jgi:hypothetical protein
MTATENLAIVTGYSIAFKTAADILAYATMKAAYLIAISCYNSYYPPLKILQ